MKYLIQEIWRSVTGQFRHRKVRLYDILAGQTMLAVQRNMLQQLAGRFTSERKSNLDCIRPASLVDWKSAEQQVGS